MYLIIKIMNKPSLCFLFSSLFLIGCSVSNVQNNEVKELSSGKEILESIPVSKSQGSGRTSRPEKNVSYKWRRWDCYTTIYNKYSFSIGYVPVDTDYLLSDPVIFKLVTALVQAKDKAKLMALSHMTYKEFTEETYIPGQLYLKNNPSRIDVIYSIDGLNHRWDWEDFSIIIKPGGRGYYYDFSGVDAGESISFSDSYDCKFSKVSIKSDF